MQNSNAVLEKDMRNYILEICEKIGPRPPCSKKEAEGSKFFYNTIKKYCDKITIEKFYTHPGAYKAAFRIPMILYIIGICFYFLSPWLSLIITVISVLILWGEMCFVKEIIDPFFSKKNSQNIIGKIEPKEMRKKIIIIGSHIDSNWEFPLIRKIHSGFAVIIAINLFLNVILLVILLIQNFLIIFQMQVILSSIYFFFFLIFIAGVPIILIQLFFIISNRSVMGANDNLSGTAVCYELAKNLNHPKNKPNSVEIWINSYGCEEIGSKGSKAFVKSHLDEIKNAIVINVDNVGNKNGILQISTTEIFGLAKMDKKIVGLINEVANELNINIRLAPLMAYTDSLSFRRKNIATTSISSIPRSSKELLYHTRDDVIENVDFKNLVNVFKICMQIIKKIDNSCSSSYTV